MSVNAQTVIIESAALVGDPGFSRIDVPSWTIYLNASCRDVVVKLRLQQWKVTFDIVAGDPEYKQPDDCIQMSRVQINDTPSDLTTWWDVTEMPEDRFREATSGHYASMTRPTGYHAWVDTFDFNAIPDTDIVGGGKLTYWGLCDEVTNPTTQVLPVLQFMRDRVRDRMLIYGYRRLKQWDSASQAEKEWQAALSADRTRIEDRSDDARPRIRTSPRNTFGVR